MNSRTIFSKLIDSIIEPNSFFKPKTSGWKVAGLVSVIGIAATSHAVLSGVGGSFAKLLGSNLNLSRVVSASSLGAGVIDGALQFTMLATGGTAAGYFGSQAEFMATCLTGAPYAQRYESIGLSVSGLACVISYLSHIPTGCAMISQESVPEILSCMAETATSELSAYAVCAATFFAIRLIRSRSQSTEKALDNVQAPESHRKLE